jgi:hypothetical protein
MRRRDTPPRCMLQNQPCILSREKKLINCAKFHTGVIFLRTVCLVSVSGCIFTKTQIRVSPSALFGCLLLTFA